MESTQLNCFENMSDKEHNIELNISSWKTIIKGCTQYWFADEDEVYETTHLVDVSSVEREDGIGWVENGKEFMISVD